MSRLYLSHQGRVRIILNGIIFIGLIIIFRLFYIQVLNANGSGTGSFPSIDMGNGLIPTEIRYSSNNSNQDITLDPAGTGRVAVNSSLIPVDTAQESLGLATKQWLTVFAGTGTFGTTSANSSLHNPGSAPGSPTNGMIYYDSTAHKFKGYANGAWVDLH